MKPINLGIIGLGHIGRRHAELLLEGRVPNACLQAAATTQPEWILSRAPHLHVYTDYAALLRDASVEGVILCTPHRTHVPWALEALKSGKHVLIEKPVAADWRETEALCRLRDEAHRTVGVMFHLRTSPEYRTIKDLLQAKNLGRIGRVMWTMTAWYRDQDYFDGSTWRGTWEGEGGGVLLNQCSHQLDLLCWYLGMPSRLQASCAFGKYHQIEVEDEASLLLDYPDGPSAVFVASTGELQGENRLEIVGSEGALRLDGDGLRIHHGGPWQVMPSSGNNLPPDEGHAQVMQQFAAAIRTGEPVMVSVEEAVQSLQIGQAALDSARTGRRVEFPLK